MAPKKVQQHVLKKPAASLTRQLINMLAPCLLFNASLVALSDRDGMVNNVLQCKSLHIMFS